MADDTELKRTFANTTEQLRYVAKEKSCWACTVGQFFETFVENKDDEYQVSIPPYQRDYAWTEVQLNQLLSDLGKVKDRELGGAYHLGTIILHRNGNRLDVVDGQQRLRTFDLILNGGDPHLGYDDKTPDGRKAFENAKDLVGNVNNTLNEVLRHGTLVCIAVDNLDEAFQLFTTQNGRGQELSGENLLKAFHYHEMTHGDSFSCPKPERLSELEQQWEETVVGTGAKHEVRHVLTQHLFLARLWARGEWRKGHAVAKKESFDKVRHLNEYKGLTLNREAYPMQNILGLCDLMRKELRSGGMLSGLVRAYFLPRLSQKTRLIDFTLDPFVTISQPIVNGEDFFEYARTYAQLAQILFDENKQEVTSEAVEKFRDFYKTYCLKSSQEKYAREVYETFILMTVDRFGEMGLSTLYRLLWILAYYERLTKQRLVYSSAGDTYGFEVCSLLAFGSTLETVKTEVKKLVEEAVKGIDDYKETYKTEKERKKRYKEIKDLSAQGIR